MTEIRVVLADDEELVRSAIALLLMAEPDITVVAEARDGDEAVTAALTLRPDVVVMDVRMPRRDGVEATRLITAANDTNDLPPIRVLMLTTYKLDEAVLRALRAGAAGFALKDVAPRTFATAIRTVAAGEPWLDPAATRALVNEFSDRSGNPTPRPAATRGSDTENLTVREIEVLQLIAQGKSNTEIGAEIYVTEATVKTHVRSIYRKIGARDRAQAVAYAFRNGIIHG